MTRFDVIVLGAGPGGSAAAVTAARASLRVALVDKHRFPRNKLCGGGFTGRSMKYCREIFGDPIPDFPLLSRTGVTFCAFGQELGAYRDVPAIHMTMRTTLDHALMHAALDAGAQDFTGQRVLSIDPDTPAVTLGGTTLTADLLIAADGVSSPTARALYGKPFDQRRIGFALEVELPSDAPAQSEVRIDFGAANWGYGWDFPKTCGRTIGVGGVLSRNTDMKGALARYLGLLGIPKGQTVKGQFLPFGNYRRIPGRGPTLLVGDAAGLVDPITGEGIAFALKSGQNAGQAAIAALGHGMPETALGHYRTAIGPIHRAISQSRMIRPLLFLPAFRKGFISGFRNSSTLRQDYMRLLAGEAEYGTITRQTAARLPRFVTRALKASFRPDHSSAPPLP